MTLKVIQITDKQMAYLEKAFYELNGLQVLVNQFTGDSDFKVDTEMYRTLLDRYNDKYVEVEIIKNAMIKEFVIPQVDGRTFEVNFDFFRDEIQVMLK